LYLAGPRCEHIAHSRAAESEKVKIDRTQLEEENRRLKQLVADLSLDKLMLQDMLQKNVSVGASWSGTWSGRTG